MRFPRPLNERTLGHHSARVTVPTYDRRALRRGVVHISVGSFHRAHQAVYFDELAQRGLGDGWALTGVGLRRREMRDVLMAQDGLYTVVSRDEEREEARVVGVITRYLFAPEETEAVLDALVDAATRVVTLTITASGYLADSDAGALGLVIEALERRRRAGRAPFTVLSCDNMPGNGAIARAAVLSIAAQRDDRLTTWIEEHVTFPSSMVDRITPGTTDADRRMVAKTFGVRDQWPVMTEPFSQWVIEDEFCNGRPPLDDVGVQFVSDVRPYALMKTRLLNASHSALGYLGSLAGHECTDELMRDPVFAAYTRQLMEDEISPLLPAVTTNLPTYCATVRKRLANRAIADRLRRLCRNGSAKVPAHLLSSIAEAREAGRPHELLTLAVAGWCQYLREIAPAELDDPQGARLQALARASAKDPRPLLADAATFGALGRCARFGAAVQRDMRDLAARGATAVVADRALQPLRAAS